MLAPAHVRPDRRSVWAFEWGPKRMGNTNLPRDQPIDKLRLEILELRRELRELHRLLDDFAGTFLHSKFPYGVGRSGDRDRWPRRRHG